MALSTLYFFAYAMDLLIEADTLSNFARLTKKDTTLFKVTVVWNRVIIYGPSQPWFRECS